MPVVNDREKFLNIETIIFDMDGVVTSESEYWNAADLTVLELLYGGQFVGLNNETFQTIMVKPGAPVTLSHFVSEDFIAYLKNSGINTNWDLAYFSFALYLIDLIVSAGPRDKVAAVLDEPFSAGTLREIGRLIPGRNMLLEKIDGNSAYFKSFRNRRMKQKPLRETSAEPQKRAERFVEDINDWRYERTGLAKPVFQRSGPMWDLVVALFQQRYLGDRLYERDNGPAPSEIHKDGMIQFEEPVIPAGKIISAMAMLKEAGLRLGIATGRPYDEIIEPLRRWGLHHFFESDRIATHREIAEAEKWMAGNRKHESISKPHPYVYLKSLYPEKGIEELIDMKLPFPDDAGKKILIVGDSLSDIMAARKMNTCAAIVLTGIKSLEAVEQMKALDPEFVLTDVSKIEKLF